jgi:thioredoxin-like negative regulator of GroEL
MSCLDVDNDNNLAKFNNEHTKGVWFVWFYADWCGHCTHMNPHWEELKSNNNHGVKLAKVRDDFIPRINNSPPVQGYPTILLYKNGKVEEIYQGERSGDAFNSFLSEKVNSGVNVMNTNTNLGIRNNNNVVRLEKPKKKKTKSQKKKKSGKKTKGASSNNNNNKNKKQTPKKKKTKSQKKKAKKSSGQN